MNKQETVSKTAKSIYMKLYRKGINVSTKMIESEIESISDDGILNDEQKQAIIDKFENSNPAQDISADVTGVDETEFSLEPETNSLTAQPENSEQPPVTSSALSFKEANNLVFSKIIELDLEIATSDLKTIASEIVSRNLSEADALAYISEVILGLLKRQENQYSANLRETISTVISEVNDSYSRRNMMLTESVNTLKVELEESTSAYKSSISKFKENLSASFQA